jgi:hypothetical protein
LYLRQAVFIAAAPADNWSALIKVLIYVVGETYSPAFLSRTKPCLIFYVAQKFQQQTPEYLPL